MTRQTRKQFPKSIGLTAAYGIAMLASVIMLSVAEAAKPAKPNIVFILADHWGLERTGCYGADTFKTPHLDALAAGGLRFQTCYATPYCGPTRAELMTGRYPFRTGALGNGLAASVDPKREFGLPAILRQAGYATALAGKWRQMIGVLGRGDDASAMWRVLGGPEKEKGDAVQILHNANGNVSVSVQGRRGTVLRQFQSTRIPAILTFRFQSTFDPKAREIPTELFGTGDFRIFVGTSGLALNGGESIEADLGSYEGFQFRIFPHLKDSPERSKTGDESHTATSLWVRYSDPKRRLDGMGLPHTGLMSDAAQNRNRQNGIHNCGWFRVSLNPGGFGLPNGAPAEVTIRITRELISIEAGGRRFSHPLRGNERRITQIDTIAVSHTNISRGYQSFSLSDLRLSQLPE